jgi:putative Mg2+ transporter-C (MgtC) family protein
MAGLRTNALVAVGTTLFVLFAYGFSCATADPTRVAAQIVSGIGFLGAGVIMRDGLNVRGLNTAATLWCSAAVGALAGAGMFTVALAGTVLVVVVNGALRAAGRVVDRRPDTGDERPTFYTFVAVTRDEQEAHVQALTRTEFRVRSIASSNTGTNGHVEVRAELVGDQRDDRQMESAVSRPSLEPSVTSIRWASDDLPETNRQIPDPTAVGTGVVSRLTLDLIQI